MPGVSTKAICAWGWSPCAARWRTARMRLRVVCGLAETAATCMPSMRFTNVDLPTFGIPTMAQKPARIEGRSLAGSVIAARIAHGAASRQGQPRCRTRAKGASTRWPLPLGDVTVRAMARVSLMIALTALIAAVLPSPGMYIGLGAGVAALGYGWTAYARPDRPSQERLFGAAAMTIGSAGAVFGALRIALTLAAIGKLERLLGG